MYCSHCAKKINENKIESKANSHALVEASADAKVNYVCPQCGHLIHEDLSKEEVKSLSRASHAQLQRSSNKLATGLSFTALGIILFIVACIFFVLAKKPSNNFQLVTTCAEFFVSIILYVISLVLLAFGVTNLVIGLNKKITYTKLLKDINNETFVQ